MHLETTQSQNSGRGFVDVLGDYVRLTESVQRVLDWRLAKLGDLQQAERDLEKLKSKNNSKLETQITAVCVRLPLSKILFLSRFEF